MSTIYQPYRPPTPPRQTERRRYSRGFATTILRKDESCDRTMTRASSCNQYYESGYSQEKYYERHQSYGPRGSRVLRAESMRTSPSYMTERTQLSLGASERSMPWSGGMNFVATTEGYQSFPVIPTISHTEIRDKELREPEHDGFDLIQSSRLWDRMGVWIVSLKSRSKHVLRGCCL
jgi:hypothetical protein